MMSGSFREVLIFGIAAILAAVMVLNMVLPIQEKSRLIARHGQATDRSIFPQHPRS